MKNIMTAITARNMGILLLLALMAGCEAKHVHDAGVLPDKEVAYIKSLPGWNPLSVISVQIYRIDGKKVSGNTPRFELLPGPHEIKVSCSRETPEHVNHYFVFNMSLKAGHSYKPKLDMTQDCHVDYVDEATGKVFSGTKN
jgi:hypothetical protein